MRQDDQFDNHEPAVKAGGWYLPLVLSSMAAGFALSAIGCASLDGIALAAGLPAQDAASALLSAAALHLAAAYIIELR